MSSESRGRAIVFGFAAVAVLMLVFSVISKSVTAAGTFTVSNTMNSGSGSLRQAINDAMTAGGGTIDATGVSGTIDLLTALPQLHANLIINGPGAADLTVERSFAVGTPNFRVFTIPSDRIVAINGLTIKNGKAFSGCGISNFGTLTLNNSTLTNNSATDFGGAIYNTGTLTTSNSTLSNNNSAIFGGGIFNSNGTVTVTNCTLADNSAQHGGAIYNGFGPVTISNSTLTNNSAIQVGGIYNGDTVILQSTIVAKNPSSVDPDVSGNFTSLGHNLIGDTSGSSGWVASDQLNTDPMFELDLNNHPVLKDNGGSTETIALLCGSPAIDRGNDLLSLTTDQRAFGFARTFDDPAVANAAGSDSTDIGALEMQQTCFDICLQNEGGYASLQINSQTGNYQFCCGGQSYVGKGTVTVKGRLLTLQDYGNTQRVIAKVDRSTNRATASLQSTTGWTLCTLMDRDTRNNTCSCINPGR